MKNNQWYIVAYLGPHPLFFTGHFTGHDLKPEYSVNITDGVSYVSEGEALDFQGIFGLSNTFVEEHITTNNEK